MNLNTVYDEVAAVLRTVTDVQVFDYPPNAVAPPSAIISYPDAVDYHQEYRSAASRIDNLPVVLVAGKADDRQARVLCATWASRGTAGSVPDALESASYTAIDSLTVRRVTFDTVTIAGIDYITTLFDLDISA